MSNEIATQPRTAGFDLSPQTFEQALTFAQYLADSDMVPKDFKGKPANCLIGMQWGMELGMKPLQAIQNIAVINGRPNLWGDAMLALVRSSPLCEYVTEDWMPDGTAFCKAKRRGEPEQIRTFSDADAKQAGLLGKQGPWMTGPKRMKQLRARGFALRDVFTDVLRGMGMAEEAMDAPAPGEKFMGAAEVVAPATPEFYPNAKFIELLPAWHKVITDGRKTADQIIVMASSKHPLSDAQKEAIRAVPVESDPEGGMPSQDQAAAGMVPNITLAQVKAQLLAAKGIDELYAAADLIDSVASKESRGELDAIFQTRQLELEQK